MDVIIQIIVFIVIIITVIKRFKEVGEKSEDIRTSRVPHPQSGMRRQAQSVRPSAPAPSPRMESSRPERPPWAPEHAPSLEDLFETVMERGEPEADSIPEYHGYGEESPVPEIEAPPAVSPAEQLPRIAVAVRQPELRLSFGRQAVVKGVVMSEILGPPVGLRRYGESGIL